MPHLSRKPSCSPGDSAAAVSAISFSAVQGAKSVGDRTWKVFHDVICQGDMRLLAWRLRRRRRLREQPLRSRSFPRQQVASSRNGIAEGSAVTC